MDSLPPSVLGPILTTIGQQLVGSKYGTTATWFVFAYDHLLTLPEEIEYIWKRKFSVVTFLFFINRYYALCTFTVTLMTLVLPDFTQSDCDHSVFFAPFMTGIPLTIFPDLVIAIRVYALYGRNKLLGIFLITYILAETSVALWLYITPSLHAITLPGPPEVNDIPVLHDCFVNTSASLTSWQSAAYQFMQSGFDTIAFLLIAYSTFSEAFRLRAAPGSNRSLKYLMAEDGILYYAVAFLCNLTWALMILFAPTGLKYAAAESTVQLVCLSVNRLTLSLRSFQSPSIMPEVNGGNDNHGTPNVRYRSRSRRASWIGTSTFEIGADFEPKILDYGELHSVDTSCETINLKDTSTYSEALSKRSEATLNY